MARAAPNLRVVERVIANARRRYQKAGMGSIIMWRARDRARPHRDFIVSNRS